MVDHGREVGIFTDRYVVFMTGSTPLTLITSALSARAIDGVTNGRRVKVKTWYEAATLYNSLWNECLIYRVPC